MLASRYIHEFDRYAYGLSFKDKLLTTVVRSKLHAGAILPKEHTTATRPPSILLPMFAFLTLHCMLRMTLYVPEMTSKCASTNLAPGCRGIGAAIRRDQAEPIRCLANYDDGRAHWLVRVRWDSLVSQTCKSRTRLSVVVAALICDDSDWQFLAQNGR